MATYRLMDGLAGRPGVGSSGTQPPASPTSYSGPFLAGTAFGVTTGGTWLQGYWHWVPPGGDTVARKFALWSQTAAVTGTLIPPATVTSGTLTAGAMNFVPLPSPIQLAISGTYVAATGWPATAGFPDSQNQFASSDPYVAGITNGPITAYSDGTAGGTHNGPYPQVQGLFSVAGTDPTVHMPNGGSSSANFWVDVEVSDTAPASYAGSWRLWPNKADTSPSTTADSTVTDDVATRVSLAQPCTVSSVWYWSPPGVTQLATAVSIYQVTSGGLSGTLAYSNTSPAWSGAAGSGWVSAPVTGLTLGAGTYSVGVYNGTASEATGKDSGTDYWRNGPGGNGITSGPLSAPGLATAPLAYTYNGNPAGNPPYSDGTTQAGQSVFSQGPPDQYQYLFAPVPTPAAGSTQNYWVDIEVTPLPAVAASPPQLRVSRTEISGGRGGGMNRVVRV